jgi:hypothetical protein
MKSNDTSFFIQVRSASHGALGKIALPKELDLSISIFQARGLIMGFVKNV